MIINTLYATYLDDPTTGLEPLLSSIRSKAASILRDEDSAQDFVLSVWSALPTLVIRSSFSAWLNVRLRWHHLGQLRKSRNRREDQIPEEMELAAQVQGSAPELSTISDPIVRRYAELLTEGYTKIEAATELGIKPATLRQRVWRYQHR